MNTSWTAKLRACIQERHGRAAVYSERIVLFGSAARGELKASSDIDLLALVSRESAQLESGKASSLSVESEKCGRSLQAKAYDAAITLQKQLSGAGVPGFVPIVRVRNLLSSKSHTTKIPL